MLPVMFAIIWPVVSEEENVDISDNQKQELPVAAMFVIRSGRNEETLERASNRCFLPCLVPFGEVVSDKIFEILANQKQELPMAATMLYDQDEMRKLYRGPSMDSSCHVWFHLAR